MGPMFEKCTVVIPLLDDSKASRYIQTYDLYFTVHKHFLWHISVHFSVDTQVNLTKDGVFIYSDDYMRQKR